MAVRDRSGSVSGRRTLFDRVRRLLPLVPLVLLGAFCWQTEILRLVDLRAQQFALKVIDAPLPESRHLLVVAPESAQTPHSSYANILQSVAALNPRALIVTDPPPEDAISALTSLEKSGRLFLGQRLRSPSLASDALELDVAVENPRGLPVVVLGHTRDVHGLHIEQLSHFANDTVSLPAPSTALAPLFDRPAGDFRIDFANAWKRIPHVSWDRVATGGLIEELVRDRVVLVATNTDMTRSPVSSLAGARTPALLLDALALDTWLQEREPLEIPLTILLVAMVVLLLLGLFIFQWLSYRLSAIATIWSSLLIGLGAPLALVFLNIDVPGSVFIMTLTWAALSILYGKIQTEDRQFKKALLSASLRIQEDRLVRNQDSAKDPWQESFDLTTQVFTGQRIALLEVGSSGRRIEQLYTHNCSDDEIVERRRNVRRSPYTDAMAQHRYVELTASQTYRPFLNEADDERQFIVAMRTPQSIVGFIVLGLSRDFIESNPDIEDLVRLVSVCSAELIDSAIQADAAEAGTRIVDYMSLRGGRLLSRSVVRSGEIVGRKLADLENLFDQLGTATVAYDLFGTVLYCNHRMLDFASGTDLRPEKNKLATTIGELTNLNADEISEVVRELIVSGQPRRLPLREEFNALGKHHVLNIRRADDKSDGGDGQQEVDPAALLLEIVEIGREMKTARAREKLSRHIENQLRDHLATIRAANSTLDREKLDSDSRQRVARKIERELRNATNLLSLESASSTADDTTQKVSVADPLEVIRRVQASVQTRYTNLGIELEIESPPNAHLVSCDPDDLAESLGLILAILAKDTVTDGSVHVEAVEHKRFFNIEIRNQGYGMPESQLRAYLTGTDPGATEDYRKLRKALKSLQRGGTRIRVQSAVTKGITFNLAITKIQADEERNEQAS